MINTAEAIRPEGESQGESSVSCLYFTMEAKTKGLQRTESLEARHPGREALERSEQVNVDSHAQLG